MFIGSALCGWLFKIPKLLGWLLCKVLVLPYKVLSHAFGHFIAVCLYVPLMFILFGLFIKLFEHHVVEKSPWGSSMTLFHTLPYNERQELIDMTEMAAFVYFDSEAPKRLRILKQKGYQPTKIYKMHEGGLNYFVMEKGNVFYVLFRGSVNTGDFLDDANIWGSSEKLSSLGRFVEALDVSRKLINQYPQRQFVFVGHSLGGSTVQYVMKKLSAGDYPDLKAYTINPFGLPAGCIEVKKGEIKPFYDTRIVDIVHEADIAQTVTLDDRVFGRGILVRGKYTLQQNGKWEPDFIAPVGVSITDSISQHSVSKTLENMKDQHEGRYNPPTDLPTLQNTDLAAPSEIDIRMSDLLDR